MISLKVEGTEIAIEEKVLKDVVMSGLPGWLVSMANKDMKSKTVYLGVKGVAIMMLGDIRRKAAKQGLILPEPADDEDPVVTLANMLLNYSVEFIEGQSAKAIYHVDGDRIIVTGVEVGGQVYDVNQIEAPKELEGTPLAEATK
ncbi:MAG: hypothetical protein JRN02_07240 [Nitrososphaerota archaeon]|nr:hypothetical protein [Nitrososphaerota archaeon]